MALVVVHARRLAEVIVDFAIVGAAFSASYLLFVHGQGSDYQKHIFVVTLPALLAARFALFIPFVAIDLAFFSANVEKIAAGGWFPLAVGVGVFAIMTTWWRGRMELSKTMETGTIPDEMFLAAAGTLARAVSSERLAAGALYPPLSELRRISRQIAVAVGRLARNIGIMTAEDVRTSRPAAACVDVGSGDQ